MKIELNGNYKYQGKKVKVINLDPIVVIDDTGGVYRCGEGDLKPIAPDVVEPKNNFPAVGTKLRFKVAGFQGTSSKVGDIVEVRGHKNNFLLTTRLDDFNNDYWFTSQWQNGLEVVPALKLEVGKYYENRVGEVVGPIRLSNTGCYGFDYWGHRESQLIEMGFREDGTYRIGGQEDERDLVKEVPAPLTIPTTEFKLLRKGSSVVSPDSYDPYIRELLIKDGWKEIIVVEKSH